MIILNLKISETTIIGNKVTITNLKVKGNPVCIRVNTPKGVSMHDI